MKRKAGPKSGSLPPFQLRYPLVMIEWVDASRLSDGWIDLADVPASYLHRCVTVGFLVSSNKDGKTIVPTIGDIEHPDNGHTYGGMMIPAVAIISERVLK